MTAPVYPGGLVPSMPPALVEPRPRSASEIIDVSIQLVRRDAPAFLTVAAIANIPLLIVQATVFRGQMVMLQTGVPAPISPLLFLLFGSGAFIWYAICFGALIVAADDAYHGRPIDPWHSFQRTFPFTIDIAIALILKYFLATLGLFVFIVGMLYVLARYFAVPATAIIERRSAFGALDRSAELSRGMKSHILSALTLAGLIYFAVNVVAGVSGAGLAALTGGFAAWLQIMSAFSSILLFPLLPTVQTVLYYDAVTRQRLLAASNPLPGVGGVAAGRPAPGAN